MGIHDRDYYRDDGGRWGAASAHRGVIALIAVTVALSLMNFVVTEPTKVTVPTGETVNGEPVYVQRDGEPVHVIADALQYDHAKVVGEFQVWRFFTSFLIASPGMIFLSLIFGGLLLYFFGGEMEILYGTGRFLAMYLLTGVLANVVKFPLGLYGATAPTFGTAAPMFATMVLFAFHYPHRPIRIWFLIPIPVWILVSIYLGLHLLGLLGALRHPSALPGAMEPLIGAAVGFAYYRTRGRVFGFVDMLGGLFRRREQSRSPANLRVYDDNAPRPSTRSASPPPPASPEPVPQPAASGGVDEHLEAKLDAVLAKVARQGKGSLTADENDILMRASEVFKRKRR